MIPRWQVTFFENSKSYFVFDDFMIFLSCRYFIRNMLLSFHFFKDLNAQ